MSLWMSACSPSPKVDLSADNYVYTGQSTCNTYLRYCRQLCIYGSEHMQHISKVSVTDEEVNVKLWL